MYTVRVYTTSIKYLSVLTGATIPYNFSLKRHTDLSLEYITLLKVYPLGNVLAICWIECLQFNYVGMNHIPANMDCSIAFSIRGFDTSYDRIAITKQHINSINIIPAIKISLL